MRSINPGWNTLKFFIGFQGVAVQHWVNIRSIIVGKAYRLIGADNAWITAARAIGCARGYLVWRSGWADCMLAQKVKSKAPEFCCSGASILTPVPQFQWAWRGDYQNLSLRTDRANFLIRLFERPALSLLQLRMIRYALTPSATRQKTMPMLNWNVVMRSPHKTQQWILSTREVLRKAGLLQIDSVNAAGERKLIFRIVLGRQDAEGGGIGCVTFAWLSHAPIRIYGYSIAASTRDSGHV